MKTVFDPIINIITFFKDNNSFKDTIIPIKNIINNHEIPFIDINKEVFEKEENPLKLFPFEVFGHYTAEGYEKISKAIYNLTSNYN